jgi:hypothetical protein
MTRIPPFLLGHLGKISTKFITLHILKLYAPVAFSIFTTIFKGLFEIGK